MKNINQATEYPLIDYQLGKAQDEAAKKAARRKLVEMAEDALRFHEIGLETVAGKVLRTVARIAGLDSLHRSRAELAEDGDVDCKKSSIPGAIRVLSKTGLLRRGVTTDERLFTGLALQVNFEEVHSASEKWKQSSQVVSVVWESCATGSATVAPPVVTPVAPTTNTIYPSIPNYPSSHGTFEEVEEELSNLDVGEANQAVESARRRGCAPSHIRDLIQHFKKLLGENHQRWDAPSYALFLRVKSASPNIPIERGWLSPRNNPYDTGQAYRKAAREALKSKIQVAPEERSIGFSEEDRRIIANFGRPGA